jgi:predicted nucleic acid-binding protein
VTLLDAYALIAILTGDPAASRVRAILREGGVAVATANLAEVLDVSERVRGLPSARAVEHLEPLFGGALTVVPLDLPIAVRAAQTRAAHYQRSSRPISLADAILLASAQPGDRIATSDPDVLAVAAARGLDTVPLLGEG